jgi:hypothetical protein
MYENLSNSVFKAYTAARRHDIGSVGNVGAKRLEADKDVL